MLLHEVEVGVGSGVLLPAAEEVFVTNSLLRMMPVGRVDERSYDVARNPVPMGISEKFRALEMESVSAG